MYVDNAYYYKELTRYLYVRYTFTFKLNLNNNFKLLSMLIQTLLLSIFYSNNEIEPQNLKF